MPERSRHRDAVASINLESPVKLKDSDSSHSHPRIAPTKSTIATKCYVHKPTPAASTHTELNTDIENPRYECHVESSRSHNATQGPATKLSKVSSNTEPHSDSSHPNTIILAAPNPPKSPLRTSTSQSPHSDDSRTATVSRKRKLSTVSTENYTPCPSSSDTNALTSATFSEQAFTIPTALGTATEGDLPYSWADLLEFFGA